MATKHVVTLIDDVTGEEAAETLTFSLDGADYEIDLSDENAQRLRSEMSTWTQHARRSGGRKRPTSTRPATRASGNRHSPEHLKAVRRWARENGHSVSEKGRIPQAVMQAFEAAV